MRSNMQAAAFVSYGGALGPRSVQQVGCHSYGLPVHSLIGSILLHVLTQAADLEEAPA